MRARSSSASAARCSTRARTSARARTIRCSRSCTARSCSAAGARPASGSRSSPSRSIRPAATPPRTDARPAVNTKVSVVGGGNVGANTALYIAERGLADVTLIDIVEGMPQGKALDLTQAAPLWHSGARVTGATSLADVKGSSVVVITAGFPRKPGMSRSDLPKANADIVGPAAEAVKKHAPNAFVIVVTNPLDVMTYVAWRKTGFPRQRVLGMAGVLDSTRMRAFVAMELNVCAYDVQAMVLGGHGDSMVPLPRYTTVGGVPITELLPKERIEAIAQRTRDGGAEIVKLLKTGSAYYAPAMSAVEMVGS